MKAIKIKFDYIEYNYMDSKLMAVTESGPMPEFIFTNVEPVDIVEALGMEIEGENAITTDYFGRERSLFLDDAVRDLGQEDLGIVANYLLDLWMCEINYN